MAGKQSRIAEAYVQIIPVLSDSFVAQMKKAMNEALRSLNYSQLESRLKQAGKQGGHDFRMAFESAAANAAVDFSKTVADAKKAGDTSGRHFATNFSSTADKSTVDFNHLKSEAGGVGRAIGDDIATQIQMALNSLKLDLPDPQKMKIAPWDQSNKQESPQPSSPSSPQSPNSEKEGGAWKSRVGGVIGGIGVAGALRFGVGAAADYDEQARRITAAIGGTEKAVPKISRAIKDLQRQGFDFESSVLAVEAALASNPKAINGTQEDINKLSDSVAKLGAQFDTDLPNSALAASVMVRNKLVPSFEHGIAVLGVAMNNVPMQLRDEFAEIFNEFSKNYKGMGFNAERSAFLVAEAGKEGGTMGMSQMSDFLKEGGIAMTDMNNEEIADQLKLFGIDQKDAAAAFYAGGEQSEAMMDKVVKAIMGLPTQVERGTAAKLLFGTPMEDLGNTEIDSILTRVNRSDGTEFGDVSKQFDANAEVAMGGWKREIVGILNEMKIIFVEGIEPMIDRLTPLLERFRNFLVENREFLKALVVPGTIVLGIVSALVAAGVNLAPVLLLSLAVLKHIPGAGAVAGVAWAKVGGVVAGVATAIKGISIGALGAAAGIGALFAGVFLLGASIGTLIYGLWTDYDGTMLNLRTQWGWFGKAIAGTVDFLGKALGWVIDGISDGLTWLGNKINGLKDKLWDALGWLSELFTGGMINVNTSFGGGVRKAMDAQNFFGMLPKMATGGDVLGPTAVIVGEKEPETIVNRSVMNEALKSITARLDAQEDEKGTKIFSPKITINQQPGESAEDLLRKMEDRLVEINDSIMR